MKTLGFWLFNNDRKLADSMFQGTLVSILRELDKAGVTQALGSGRFTDEQREFTAGYLIQLLDGGTSLTTYHPPPALTAEMIAEAETALEHIASRPTSQLHILATSAGILLAINLWYNARFSEAVTVATHIVSMSPRTAEAYRVRGLAHFAIGDLVAASRDLEQA
ncbi:MAG: hypothetical protein ACR2KS_02555, partial [Candidatus Eremiobacter antarcticus]